MLQLWQLTSQLLKENWTWKVAPCKGIWIPESWNFFTVESGILGFGIGNTAKDWNQETGFHKQTTWNPESTTWNPESKGAFLWDDPDQDLWSEIIRIMVDQMNRWIIVESGFIGYFDLPWSDWSRITDPDPDHLKGTHPKTLGFYYMGWERGQF